MSSDLEQLVVKAVAKKKGIPEDQANAYVAAMKEDLGEDGLQKWMASLTANADVIQKLPQEVQKDLVGLMAARLGGESGGKRHSSGEELALRMAAIREAFRSDEHQGPTTDPEVKEQMSKLLETIEGMKEEKRQKEYEEMKKELNDKLEAINQKLAGGPTPDEADEIEKMAKEAEKLSLKQTTLRKMLGIPEQPAETALTAESARKHLETMGYRVEGPKTVAELEKEFGAKLEKMKQEAKDEAKKEMKAEERRYEILADIGGSIIETVIPVLGKGGGQKALAGAATALRNAAQAGA